MKATVVIPYASHLQAEQELAGTSTYTPKHSYMHTNKLVYSEAFQKTFYIETRHLTNINILQTCSSWGFLAALPAGDPKICWSG